MLKSDKLANSNLATFSIDESQIKKQIEKALNLAKPKPDQLKLNEDQAIVQPLDQDFLCGLCSFVVCNPSECDKCDKLSCKNCLKKWKEKKSECAYCRQKYTISRPNRKVMEQLNQLMFSCEKCKEQVKYGEYEAHVNKCSRRSVKCPNVCDPKL
jgi:hypothetical protein